MTLERDARRLTVAFNFAGYQLALAYLPLVRAMARLGGAKATPGLDRAERELNRKSDAAQDELESLGT